MAAERSPARAGGEQEEIPLNRLVIEAVRAQIVVAQDALLGAHIRVENADSDTKHLFGYTELVNMTTFQIQILGIVKTLQDMIKTVDETLEN